MGRGVPGATPGRFPLHMANTYVYDFDEEAAGGRELLGGKGSASPR